MLVIIVPLLLAGLACLLLYYVPQLQAQARQLAMISSFLPYGIIFWVLALLLSLIAGGLRVPAVLSGIGLIAHAVILLPYFFSPTIDSSSQGNAFTVLTLNMEFGHADTDQLAQKVQSVQPDVVVLTEITVSARDRVSTAEWKRWFPYRLGTASPDSSDQPSGTMVLSTHPITEVAAASGTAFENFAVRLELGSRTITLVAAHPLNPVHGLGVWLDDASDLARLASQYDDGPLIVAGDLNATPEHYTLRKLKAAAKLTDAADGFGWHPTYPADTSYPPLIAIDHVLISQDFRARSVSTVKIDDTDHLGLLVRLTLT